MKRCSECGNVINQEQFTFGVCMKCYLEALVQLYGNKDEFEKGRKDDTKKQDV